MPSDPDVLMKPAMAGILGVCKAAQKWKAKRIVLTSSMASVNSCPPAGVIEFDENSWSNADLCPPHMKSVTLSEKAAWDFVKDLPEDEKFEVVSMNPGFVVGPPLISHRFSSGDFVEQMMFGKMPILNFCMDCIDVRDLAKAHL